MNSRLSNRSLLTALATLIVAVCAYFLFAALSGGGGTGSWIGLTSGPNGQTSGPIEQQTIFTLSCTRLDGSPMNPETATANVVPVFQEI